MRTIGEWRKKIIIVKKRKDNKNYIISVKIIFATEKNRSNFLNIYSCQNESNLQKKKIK